MPYIKAEDTRICVVMVGLPARGKSLIAQKVVRYLTWLSIKAKIFNVGSYRRADTPSPPASFFDTSNKEGERLRKAAAEAAVTDMMKWFFTEGGSIAILDATNSSKARRKWINDWCSKEGIEVLFVESKCDDEQLIMSNIREVKTTSPDYKGQDPEAAAADFRNRIRNYERVYETIDETEESHLTYVKLINVNTNVIINGIKDYLQSRIVYYLMNLHIKPRSIWISRHGESEYNLEGLLGGDANLSPRGFMYAKKLPQMVRESGAPSKMTVWTSTLKRTIQTAEHLLEQNDYSKLEWKALDELDAGVCDGLTYSQIEDEYPEDFRARDADKYNYRYRGGESYRDVVIRLEPIIMELERSENIMIVTHQAVLRCIYAYFMKVPMERSPWMEVPLHTLIRLTPKAYGTHEERWSANIPAVSTFRARGTSARVSDAGKDLPAAKKAREELKLTTLNENAVEGDEMSDGDVPRENATPTRTRVLHVDGQTREEKEAALTANSVSVVDKASSGESGDSKPSIDKTVASPGEVDVKSAGSGEAQIPNGDNEGKSSSITGGFSNLVAKAVSKIQLEDPS